MKKCFSWSFGLIFFGLQATYSAIGSAADLPRAAPPPSASEKGARVALVIGNSRYPSGALANPKNDATAMAASLKKLGFDVELKIDASKADMNAVFKLFSAKAEKASVAALFYAGHGMQVGGQNYVVPIDANPRNEKDLKREMVKLDDVIDDMGEAKVKLLFFDACRDNPLARTFSRGGSRGMAAPVEATGTLISFATKHGNTAWDGDSMHSPYTKALLAALEDPTGVEIEQLLRRVQQDVKSATDGQQEPWRYGSLDGDFYFKASEPMNTAKAQQEAVERAVADALRKANEQAARDRDEIKQTMEQVLKEALARQTAALEAERAARATAAPAGAPAPTSPQATGQPATVAQPPKFIIEKPTPAAAKPPQPAAIAPTATSAGVGAKPSKQAVGNLAIAPGDEWEYLAHDEVFGKKRKLVLRVKAASSEGVLEEIYWNDKPVQEWVSGERAAALGTPNEAHFMFASHWNGNELPVLMVEGGTGVCVGQASCRIELKVTGNEKLTVAAGTFDAVRLDGAITMIHPRGATSGSVTIWYSKDQRRLLKQTAAKYSGQFKFKETLELSAIRRAQQ